MGASGIKRRKPKHELPEAGKLTPGDARRVFGIFRYGTYTVEGSIERGGFFARQFERNGSEPGWRNVIQARWVFVAFVVVIGAFALADWLIG